MAARAGEPLIGNGRLDVPPPSLPNAAKVAAQPRPLVSRSDALDEPPDAPSLFVGRRLPLSSPESRRTDFDRKFRPPLYRATAHRAVGTVVPNSARVRYCARSKPGISLVWDGGPCDRREALSPTPRGPSSRFRSSRGPVSRLCDVISHQDARAPGSLAAAAAGLEDRRRTRDLPLRRSRQELDGMTRATPSSKRGMIEAGRGWS